MRRFVLAAVVSGLALVACGNEGDLEAFCDAAAEAAEAARDVDPSASPDELRLAYETVDVQIQEMAKTAPEVIAGDMRLVRLAWDANLKALDRVDYDIDALPEQEDPDEGDEFAAATDDVEAFVSEECDVELDAGTR